MSDAPDATEKRATLLASTALGLFSAGRIEDAARALRQAIHLSPQNPQVRAAFQHIQEKQDSGSRIPDLARKLLEDGSVTSGEEAISIVQGGGSIGKDEARSVVLAILQFEGENEVRRTAGKLFAVLVNGNVDGKAQLVALAASGDMRGKIFGKVVELGAEALEALTATTLDEKSWKQGQQDEVLGAYFVFLLEKVGSSSPDESCLRPLSKLLAVKADILHPAVDSSTLERLLGLVQNGTTDEARTASLLATSKYLESLEQEKSTKLLGEFLTQRIASNDDDAISLAFNVAASLFPVATTTLSALFLTEGFAQSLIPSLQGRSQAVEVAAINLMSAACVDKASRDAVSKNCEDYLKAVSASKSEGSAAATLALAKLSGNVPDSLPGQESTKAPKTDKEIESLAATFKSLLSNSSASSQQQSVEGLAYTSLTPSVKETIVSDTKTLKSLLALLTPTTNPSVLFGVLTTIDNLTHYTKPMTDEQRKLTQLKNYANAEKSTKDLEVPALNKDPRVTKRCKVVLDAGVIPALLRISKKTSPNATTLIVNILLSLSKTQEHRGTMAQQGAVRFLIQLYNSLPAPPSASEPSSSGLLSNQSDTPSPEVVIQLTASHALARLLISINPSHVFSSTLPITSALPPLIHLIQTVHTSTSETRDLLPLFESLLALTNLASTTDAVRAAINKRAFSVIEELMLSHNDMVQRAAIELVCNLMVSPETIQLFVEGPRADGRIQILLAIARADDVKSRLAAGGALAMLSEWDVGAKVLLGRKGGVERCLEICEDEDLGVVFRAVVVVRNLVIVGGEEGGKAVKKEGGVDVLKRVLEDALRRTGGGGGEGTGEDEEMVRVLVECLKVLVT